MAKKKKNKSKASRKWKLVVAVVILAALGTFIPPVISAWIFKATNTLVILSGAEFVSLITLVVAAYFGANVWQKRELKKEKSEIRIGNNEEGEAQ